jgi:hypothetical protein
MLGLYRSFLHLYPATYRREYGEEMMDVLSEVQAEARNRTVLIQVWSVAYEASGLLYGALREHFWSITGSYENGVFSIRRFAMRSEFRFPKATLTLMTIILAAVVFAIEKAKAISASIPDSSQSVGPIQPAQFTMVPSLLVTMFSALVIGVIGWAILFALRRSGVHRISEMHGSAGQRTSK